MSKNAYFKMSDLKVPSELHCSLRDYSTVSVSRYLHVMRDSCQNNKGKTLLTTAGLFVFLQR